MGQGRLSGGLIVDQRETLGLVLGEHGFRSVMESVSDEARIAYETAIGVSWIAADVVDEVVSAAARYVGKPVLQFHAELTRRNMDRTLGGVWRVLLRFTSDRALIQRTPVFYRKSYDVGVLDGDIPEPGYAVTTLRAYPDISDIQLVGLRVGIESVLAAAGREAVKGSHRRTGDGAVIECRWKRG